MSFTTLPIPSAELSTVAADARTALELGTAATEDVSTNGGANKVLKYDANADLVIGPPNSDNALGTSGRLLIPNRRQLGFMQADGSIGSSIYFWDEHSGGDETIYTSPRHCFYWSGGFQFGSPATARDGRYVYFQPNVASSGDTVVEGVPISLANFYWTGSANATNEVWLQSLPLSAAANSDVLRINFGATVGSDHRLSGGTQAAEFSRTGLNHQGTNPAFITLTPGTTVTWTVSKYLNAQHASLTLGQTSTLAFSGLLAGMTGRLKVIQPASCGPHTLILPAGSKTANGTDSVITLSTNANAVDVLHWFYDGVSIFWQVATNFTAALDSDASAYLTASGNMGDATIKNAINEFVLGTKADGTWYKMKAIYPFAGGTSTKNKYDLKLGFNITDDAAWQAATHNATTGITGNGTTAKGNLGFSPADTGTQDSLFVYIYNRTATSPSANWRPIGSQNASTNAASINISTTHIQMDGLNRAPYNSAQTAHSGNAKGHIAVNRSGSAAQQLWFNSTTVSSTAVSTGRPTQNFYILACNWSGGIDSPTTANIGFAAVGESLSAAEWATWKARVDTFVTALGRQN